MIYKNGHANPAMAFSYAMDSNPTTRPNGINNGFLYVLSANQVIPEGIHVLTDNIFNINYCRIITKRHNQYDYAVFCDDDICESVMEIRPVDLMMAGDIEGIGKPIE